MQISKRELFPPAGFAVWTGAIFYLSLHPSPPELSSTLLAWDKFQHAAAFGVLAFLGGLTFLPRVRGRGIAWLLGFSVALALGALVEVFQGTLTAGRAAEWGDLAADAFGAAVAVAAGMRLLRPFPPPADGGQH